MTLTETTLAHPLVDEAGSGWVATVCNREVVHASAARTGLLVDANKRGMQVVLVTVPHARLSWPMLQLLRDFGAAWITRNPDGTYTNAFTRGRGATISETLTAETSVPAIAPTGESVAGQVAQFTVIVHHRADADTRIGDYLQIIAQAFTGGPVTGWGFTEPASNPWDVAAVTAFAKSRMPDQARIIANATHPGGALSAVIRVNRAQQGVTETVQATVTTSSALTAAAVCEQLAAHYTVVLATAFTVTSPYGVMFSADAGVPVPAAILLGGRAVRDTGADVEALVNEHGAQKLANQRNPSLLLAFDADPAVAWQQMTRVSARFDLGKVFFALGGAPGA